MEEFRPHLRELGVTEQQWRVLRALNGVEECRLNELARRTCISMPSLSRIVPALVEKSLLMRRVDQNDGRSSQVRLTPAGQEFIDRGAARSESIYKNIEKRVGRERMNSLYQLLDELNDSLETTP